MRPGRQAFLLSLAIASLLLLAPEAVLGQGSGAPPNNLEAMLRARDPEALLGSLKEEMREQIKAQWSEMVQGDSATALKHNSDLYANPSIQAYVNRLGQSLIPKEASGNIFVTFKIVEDPLPYADALATGTIYLSTGLISLLDNESQLAFLLMHEAGHVVLSHHLNQMVEPILEAERAEKRARKMKLIGAVAGAVVGGITGGSKQDVAKGAIAGLGIAHLADLAVRSAWSYRFSKSIELEADQFATEVLLHQGFDAREASVLMAKVSNIVRRSPASVDLAFGSAQDLPQRSEKVTELLGGHYQLVVARILEGDGFRMSSPRYSQLMAELKRDNGLLSLNRDLFAIARANLEEAAAVRTDDPLTMYGLGMLYRTVGRTDEDVARAAGYLKSAMEFDEIRHRFPEVYLQYAVELLSREDPQLYPEIQKALKSYVVLHQRNKGGGLPREMPFVYDYLDLTGDRSWVTYNVSNVSSEVPYQLTGDPQVDGSAGRTKEKKAPK
jgi:hypothetical protein